MPKFSRQSEEKLRTCRIELQTVLREAIKHCDFTVVCGFRDQDEQNKAVEEGRSQLAWPNSNHNTWPSYAVDVAPYPINWKDEKEFYYLAGMILGIASQLGIRLKWGGRWKTLVDLPHFEIYRD